MQTADYTFGLLLRTIEGKPERQQNVTAHLYARTGHLALVPFHRSTVTDAEKIQLYRECLRAVITNDYASLQGQDLSLSIQVEEPLDPTIEKLMRESAQRILCQETLDCLQIVVPKNVGSAQLIVPLDVIRQFVNDRVDQRLDALLAPALVHSTS